jgi:chromosome segregation ATPase
MTDSSDRRKAAVLEAEQVILDLRRELEANQDRGRGLSRAIELMEAATGAVRRYDGTLDEFVATSRNAADAVAASTSATLNRIEASFSSATKSTLHSITAAFREQQNELKTRVVSLTGVIDDVRSSAQTAQERVTETYTDARSRLERARDELIDGRKEIVATASELRTVIVRLESAQAEFRDVVEASVRRLERVVYAAIAVGVVAIVILFGRMS